MDTKGRRPNLLEGDPDAWEYYVARVHDVGLTSNNFRLKLVRSLLKEIGEGADLDNYWKLY